MKIGQIFVVVARRDYDGSDNVRAFTDRRLAEAYRGNLAAEFEANSALWQARLAAVRVQYPDSDDAWRARHDELQKEFTLTLWPEMNGHPHGGPDEFVVETVPMIEY